MKRNRLSRIFLMIFALAALMMTFAFNSSAEYLIDADFWQELQGNTYYTFVPDYTGFYTFVSEDNDDPVGVIYDANKNEICRADDINGSEFEMKIFLLEGETYYFYAYEYGTSSSDYYINACVLPEEEAFNFQTDNWITANGLVMYYFVPEKSGYYIFEGHEDYSASGVIYDEKLNVIGSDSYEYGFSIRKYLTAGEMYFFEAADRYDEEYFVSVRLYFEDLTIELGQWDYFKDGVWYEFVPSESGYYIFESDDKKHPECYIYDEYAEEIDYYDYDFYHDFYYDDYYCDGENCDFYLKNYLTAGRTYYFEVYGSDNKVKARLRKDCPHNNMVDYPGLEATCISEGYTESQYCEDCDVWLKTKDTIEKDSSKHVNTEIKGASAASCTVAGSSGDVICKDCGTTSKKAEIIYPAHLDINADKKCDKCKAAMAASAVSKDTNEFQYTYNPPEFTGEAQTPQFTVLYKNNLLSKNLHYDNYYEGYTYYVDTVRGNVYPTANANMDIEIYGFGDDYYYIYKTINFTILKADVSRASVTVKGDTGFFGAPVTPNVEVVLDGRTLTEDTDYKVDYLNNCAVGTGTVRVVGIGNYTGYIDTYFSIAKGDTSDTVKLDEIYDVDLLSYSNNNLKIGCDDEDAPTAYCGTVNSYVSFACDDSCSHTKSSWTYTIRYGGSIVNTQTLSEGSIVRFNLIYAGVYDITLSVKEDHGGYRSGYKYDPYRGYTIWTTWWESDYQTYTRDFTIFVPSAAALPAPKTLTSETISETTHNAFIAVSSNDKNLVDYDVDSWSSSNTSVATVKDGVVTFKKAGTAVITAKVGSLSTKWTFTKNVIDLSSNGEIVNFDYETRKIAVLCDGELLSSSDYDSYIQKKGNFYIVTVKGKNLYKGSIGRVFMVEGDYPYYCSHSFSTTETSATCSKEGQRIYTCKYCSATEIVTLSKLEHQFANSFTIDKKATLSADGSKSKHCTRKGCNGKTAVTAIKKIKTVLISETEFVYNGKVQTPDVLAKTSDGTRLVKGTDYTLTYASGRKNTGKYTVKITFKGNYSGSKTFSFTIAPKKVGKLTAGTVKTNSFKIAWSKVTGADGYVVYLKNLKTGKYERYKTLSGNGSVKCTISGLKTGTNYSVKVKAYKKDGGTIWGEASSAYTFSTAPATPTLKMTSKNGKAVASWTNVAGETGYQLQFSTKKTTGFEKVKTYSANVTKGTKSGLKKGKTYYFRVRAYKKVGSQIVYSAWSSVKSVKIK